MDYKNASDIIMSNMISENLEEENPILGMVSQKYNDLETHFLQEYGQYLNGTHISMLDFLQKLQYEYTIYENFYKTMQKENIKIKNGLTIQNRKNGKINVILNQGILENIKIPFDYFYNLIAYKDSQDYKDILKRVNYIKDNLYPMIQQNGCGIKRKEQTLYQWNFKNDKIRVYIDNKVPKFEILYSKFFEKYNERSCYLYETYECMNHQAIIELIESQEFYQKQKR